MVGRFSEMVCYDAFEIEANKFRSVILARNPLHVLVNCNRYKTPQEYISKSHEIKSIELIHL